MDIRKRAGFFTLFFESFKLINNSLSSLSAFFVFAVVLLAATGYIVFLLYPFGGFLLNLATLFLTVLLIKILGARAEQEGGYFFDLAAKSLLPTVYALIISIILGVIIAVPVILFILAVYFLLSPDMIRRAAPLIACIILGGVYVFASMFLYFLPAVSLREEGPISGIKASFFLAWKHPVQTLATALVCMLLPGAVMLGLFKAAYLGIPLYFADSFNLASLSPVWYFVFFAAGIIYAAANAVDAAFLVLTFLNLDYAQNRGSVEEEQPTAEQIKLQQDIAQAERAFSPAQPAPVPIEEVAVTTASIRLATDAEEVKEHLDAVYSPENAKVQEYMHQEEDRMPTILFDEEMAKELEESRKQWENRTKKEDRPEDSDGGSIKISKR